jgi:5-(carboxyamino)imidazole ribonucleotide mutase
MKEAAEILEEFGIEFEVKIVSAHRTPTYMYEYANRASLKGLKVIIAGAGGSAHLPGMVASLTALPVIGVPIQTKALNGMDSLYSIVQMPPGIPVATVAINGAKNAGLLAAKILATADSKLQEKIEKYAKNLDKMVAEKNAKLEQLGYQKYLEQK